MGKIRQAIKTIAAGVAAGVVNGFFGSAGGIIAIESMEREGTEEKKAHATALFVIFPLSVLSAALYIHAGYFQWDAALYTGIGGIAGGLVGAAALRKLDTLFLNRLFTLIILITGVRMLF